MKRTTNIIVSTPKKANNSLFAFLVICIIAVIGFLIVEESLNNTNNDDEQEAISITSSEYIAPYHDSLNNIAETNEITTQTDTSRAPLVNSMARANEPYPRTAYLLYGDNNYQRLIRATYLTKNLDPDDSSAVRLTQQGSRIVGYDVSNNNKIANVKDISNEYQLYAAKIVYSDKDNVIVLSKDDAGSGSILYCVKGFDGKLVWAVLASSLTGIDEAKLEVASYKNGFIFKSGNNQIKITHDGKIIN